MKRVFMILLAGALLFTLLGCQASNPGSAKGNPAEPSVQIGQNYSNYDGIEVQITDGFQSENGFILKVDWINKTLCEAIFGASYTIERKEGEEWVSCAIVDDLVFNALAYILSPNQTREETYKVSQMFDVSEPGIYRFRSFCSVEGRDDTELWAEFILCEGVNEGQTKAQAIKEFGVHYIRTNGHQDGAKFPRVQIIGSLRELKDYYTTYSELFDLERKEKVYSDTTIGFLDACDQYDEAFFAENYLIFVLLEEGSGSIRHEVCGVEQTADKKISLTINRKVPEVGTDDMAEWHIILELSKEVIVETSNDVLVYLDGKLAWNGSVVEPPKPEAAFKEPPQGILFTPDGDVVLKPAGYDWTIENTDGTATTTIADQVSRPLPKDSLKPIAINSKYAETIYLPVPGSDVCEPTNSLGYLVKLAWEITPSRITCTCWPHAVWQDSNIQGKEIPVDLNGEHFYAKEGGYIYEFAVTWDDTAAGYHGTANYYVYIIGGTDHSHQVAVEAQTVENPVTGYCGNTQTTLYIGDKEYSFMYGHSVTLTDILINLDYDPMRVCRCCSEYTVDTEFGKGYEINLSQGYARCEKGQADMTQEQIDKIAEIIKWAETTNCKYPIGS